MLKLKYKAELEELIKITEDLNTIDTSLAVDMNRLFKGAESFNQPLSNWDASSVEQMDEMSVNAIKYTYSKSNWKLHSDCNTIDFLKNCIMWARFNSGDDMPLEGDERLKVPVNLKKIVEVVCLSLKTKMNL